MQIRKNVRGPIVAAAIMFALGPFSSLFAQEVKRCEGADGKVTYAEICPSGTKQSTVTHKGLSVTEAEKNQRAMEAAFQKRHLERQRLEAQERASLRSAAAQQRKLDILERKIDREIALREKQARDGSGRSVRVSKAKGKRRKQ